MRLLEQGNSGSRCRAANVNVALAYPPNPPTSPIRQSGLYSKQKPPKRPKRLGAFVWRARVSFDQQKSPAFLGGASVGGKAKPNSQPRLIVAYRDSSLTNNKRRIGDRCRAAAHGAVNGGHRVPPKWILRPAMFDARRLDKRRSLYPQKRTFDCGAISVTLGQYPTLAVQKMWK